MRRPPADAVTALAVAPSPARRRRAARVRAARSKGRRSYCRIADAERRAELLSRIWTQDPLTRMPFGKYVGHEVADLPTDYLHWLTTIEITNASLRAAVHDGWPAGVRLVPRGPSTTRPMRCRSPRP